MTVELTTPVPALAPKGAKRSIFSWCLYDWANSAFSTVIITFVFSVFFTRGMIGDETRGSALWSYAIGASGLIIALLAPILGAIADHSGARKGWIFFLSLLCIIPSSLLWYAQPGSDISNVAFVLTCVIIANVGFELSQVFYNAMLPHIAPPHLLGRVSGWAWGVGYLGGLAALAVALYGLVGIGSVEPFFGVTGAESANIRATGPLVAIWFFVFMIPLLLFTHDVERIPMNVVKAVASGFRQLGQTFKDARGHKNLIQFLVASAIYRDGLNTLFSIGGVYAAGQYGMNLVEILTFAIGLNVMAGLGAFGFAFLDDRIGSKVTALLALVGLIVVGTSILMTSDKHSFMMLAMGLGIFMGPVQASSRTLAGRLAPPGMVAQTYGLYAFTGKSVAFIGPLLYGWATSVYQTQQAGMMTIVLLWIIGGGMLFFVKERADD